MFNIKTLVFEGPLDLLLSLVEKRKLFVNDISLSNVTDEFIRFVEQKQNSSIEERANFIVVASTLLLIKSKSLLPTLDLTTEEETEIGDLELRLKLLKKYREVSALVKERFGKFISLGGGGISERVPVFAPHEKITKENMQGAILSVISGFPKKEKTPTAIVKKVISLEETISVLTNRITSSLKMSFSEFSRSRGNNSENKEEVKVNIIVTFLAMLELVKQGIISVQQEMQYGEIDMQSESVELPRYNI